MKVVQQDLFQIDEMYGLVGVHLMNIERKGHGRKMTYLFSLMI